uniref:Transcription factor TFIIIB component B n=1 Tax=Ascaris suum TaxID=6253 RepID=F1KS73_ASCSU
MKSYSAASTSSKYAASSSKKSASRSGPPRTGHKTSKSSTSSHHRPHVKSSKVTAKARKRHSDEHLDPKKMKMSDMIRWNPKNETALNRNSDKAKKQKMKIAETQEKQEEKEIQTEHNKASNKLAAPQVKLSEDGSLVLDESSLTVVNDHSSGPLETVNEGSVGCKVTSSSFRKRPRRKGTQWSDLEIEFFYDILRATGPDFGLMHEFFPSRTRDELKSKFNREEKSNLARLNEVLSSPGVLNEALFTHAEEVMKKINEEAQKKKESKMSKGERKALHAAQQESG